ncbi:fibrinogen-like protein A [Antedon mediterranea]|uniref:fibrinogen-like protein A n=1 Tax=Antedon mediterranea TaxID=105859 RepID=UPI003AF799C6
MLTSTLIIVIILPFVISDDSINTYDYTVILEGHALEGWSYELKNIHKLNCLLECSKKSDCLSVNYNQKDRVCQISCKRKREESIENNIIQTPAFCYIEKVLGTDFERQIERDCSEILQYNPSAESGEYAIQTNNGEPQFTVYCEIRSDAGWTVIQRRQDGSVNFYRNWTEYKEGFGNVNSEFWLGNEQIYRITSNGSFELLVEMTDHLDVTKFAKYSHFHIGTEESNYVLTISGYTGTAGDSLASHNGKQFTTYDRDNDKSSRNCAETFKGGWWYENCHYSNLNGLYLIPGTANYTGINWRYFHNNKNSLKKTVMMVKRVP